MTHTGSLARAGALVLLAALALGGATSPAGSVRAQGSTTGWQTFAGGDEVLALAVNPIDSDELWAATEGGGVVVWDLGAPGDFRQYLFPMQPGLGAGRVYDIAFDEQGGEAWLATEAGLSRAAPGGWTAHALEGDDLPDPPFVAVAVDDAGRVWAGGPDGLASLDPGATVWVPYPAVSFVPGDDGPQDGPGELNVADLAIGADGRVYVAHGRANSGNQPALSIYNPTDRSWRFISAIAPTDDPASGPRTDQIIALAVDAADDLWLASWGRGVLSWDGQTWTEHARADGVCSNDIWAVHAAGDEIWVACGSDRGGEGIARWDGSSWESWDAADGLASELVTTISGGDGKVYLGTNGIGTDSPDSTGGLGIIPFDGETAEEPWRTAPRTPWSNDINALAFQSDGTLWAGTRSAGLMRYRPRTGEWDQYTMASTSGKLVGDTIGDVAIRGQGELWVAVLQRVFENGRWVDGGVSRFDLASEDWLEPLRADPASPGSSLPDNNVSSLAIGSDGRVWIGMGDVIGGKGGPTQSGDGVALYDPDRDEWEQYSFDRDLAGATVVDLASAGELLWAASSYATAADAAQQRAGGGASRYSGGLWSQWGDGVQGFLSYSEDLITGDVRSVAVGGDGRARAGSYRVDADALLSTWPFVDAVVNQQQADDTWTNDVFGGQGWISALTEDRLGQVWAGTTRGHFYKSFDAFQEFAPTRNQQYDTAAGGLRVRTAGGWVEFNPWTSGLASNAVTALALDPASGAMWVGTENSGLSVYSASQLQPTPTPGTPTVPPAPTATAIGPTVGPGTAAPVHTLPPPLTRVIPTRPGNGSSGGEEEEPTPPPEVPEASTLVLLAAGLAGLAGWVGLRRRG